MKKTVTQVELAGSICFSCILLLVILKVTQTFCLSEFEKVFKMSQHHWREILCWSPEALPLLLSPIFKIIIKKVKIEHPVTALVEKCQTERAGLLIISLRDSAG